MTGTAKRVPGLDYLAEPGDDPDVSAGVIQSTAPNGSANTMEACVARRLFPHDTPIEPNANWVAPTCFNWEVILPVGAHDDLWRNPQKLCKEYDAASFPGLRDLLISLTLRAPFLEASGMKIHEYHHIVTEFIRVRIAVRGIPTIVIVHVPSRSGNPKAGPIHWHCLIAARRWSPLTGPSAFCTELLRDARGVLEREWGSWKARNLL